ncbi:MAG: endolytic transglycosylase MltG, partial [Anaerolineales bacterium]
LRAGTYFISENMTIPQISERLVDPNPVTLRLTVIEGWRMEQIAAWIDQQPLLDYSGNDFLAIVGQGAPLPPDFQSQYDIPSGASLEGFLFPATYQVPLTGDVISLRDAMLDAFARNVSAAMQRDARAQGLTMYEVVTLAAIVEREAVIAEERPQIASVYLNRLEIGQRLQADPTTQYGLAGPGDWWPQITVADYQNVHPYNTYVIDGLPPGPIANPSLSSMRAVIYPAVTPYFFFRAACDGSGLHQFAITFEEHVANACP